VVNVCCPTVVEFRLRYGARRLRTFALDCEMVMGVPTVTWTFCARASLGTAAPAASRAKIDVAVFEIFII
jgi:hypothetical protein